MGSLTGSLGWMKRQMPAAYGSAAAGEHGTAASVVVERADDVLHGRAADGHSRSDAHQRRSSPGSIALSICGWGFKKGIRLI